MSKTEEKLLAALTCALGSGSVLAIAEALRDVAKNEVACHPWHTELCEARDMLRDLHVDRTTDTSIKETLQMTIEALQSLVARLP